MFLFANAANFWIFKTVSSWYRRGRWQRTLYRALDPSKLRTLSSHDLREKRPGLKVSSLSGLKFGAYFCWHNKYASYRRVLPSATTAGDQCIYESETDGFGLSL